MFSYRITFVLLTPAFLDSTPSLPAGVQRRQRRVLDTSSTYVRGEENLHGWRPRGDSLIFDHQWELEKLTRLEEVGRVRHLLQLRERLGMDVTPNPTTKSEKDVCNLAARAGGVVAGVVPPIAACMTPLAASTPQTPVAATAVGDAGDNVEQAALAVSALNITPTAAAAAAGAVAEPEYTAAERELLLKCVHLIQGRIGQKLSSSADSTSTSSASNASTAATAAASSSSSATAPNTLAVSDAAASSPGYDEGCADMNVSYMSGHSIELCSPDRVDMPNGWEAPAPAAHQTALQPLRMYVPELEEIRVSPVVARKGYLNVLEHGGSGWKKRWVVSGCRRVLVVFFIA